MKDRDHPGGTAGLKQRNPVGQQSDLDRAGKDNLGDLLGAALLYAAESLEQSRVPADIGQRPAGGIAANFKQFPECRD